jgi:hypothetical protein
MKLICLINLLHYLFFLFHFPIQLIIQLIIQSILSRLHHIIQSNHYISVIINLSRIFLRNSSKFFSKNSQSFFKEFLQRFFPNNSQSFFQRILKVFSFFNMKYMFFSILLFSRFLNFFHEYELKFSGRVIIKKYVFLVYFDMESILSKFSSKNSNFFYREYFNLFF